MSGPSNLETNNGTELGNTIHIFKSQDKLGGISIKEEVFMAKLPVGMDRDEQERLYAQKGGQVHTTFGRQHSVKMVPLREWLTLQGAQIVTDEELELGLHL